MLREEFASKANGNGERIAARIMTQFLLRYCVGLAQIAQGDIVRGLILAAVLDANVGHLVIEGDQGALNLTVADEDRAPVSVSALSRKLSIPYETTRRQVSRLIKDGACVRVERGVIVPGVWIASQRDITTALYRSLRTMLAALDRAGFDLEGMARADS